MRFSRLISVVLLATVVLGLAEELPGPAAAVQTEKKEAVAPKLAIDCPLPLRKLLSKFECLCCWQEAAAADVV
jgi:hypothetical protein